MSNDFYRKSGIPNSHTVGSLSQLVSEFSQIETAFNKLPAFVGNSRKFLAVNSGGNGVSAVVFALAQASLSASGYYKFPGDDQLILQWLTTGDSSIGQSVVLLPITFPNTIIHAFPCAKDSGSWANNVIQEWAVDFAACTTSTLTVNHVMKRSNEAVPSIPSPGTHPLCSILALGF